MRLQSIKENRGSNGVRTAQARWRAESQAATKSSYLCTVAERQEFNLTISTPQEFLKSIGALP
jgi:hypothetical protein